MRMSKRTVVYLDQGDDMVIVAEIVNKKDAAPGPPIRRAEVHICRVGSDDPDFPFENPHLMVSFNDPYGIFSADPERDGTIKEVIVGPTTHIITGETKDDVCDHIRRHSMGKKVTIDTD